MTATAQPAARRDATAPAYPPAGGHLSRVPQGFATLFAALDLLCALLLLLVLARGGFYAVSRRGAVWRALAVLLAGLAVATLLGWGLVLLFPGTLPAGRHLAWAPTGCAAGWFRAAPSTAAHRAR